jgi:tetratricopeptide (TPR) repeat protein
MFKFISVKTNDLAEPVPAPRDLAPGPSPRRWPVCVALALLTLLAFSQALGDKFVNFDDSDYVYENPVVMAGLTKASVAWAFTHIHSANWHPLTWLSHELDCQIYGINPAGHHLTNVLLHAANVVLLFLLLRQMTGAHWRSAIVAALFAVHPLRVESVTWVAERKDVLSGLFFMLTVWAYLRYASRSFSPGRYGLVAFLFACGLMSKPMLVTLPLLLLLLDFWPLQRRDSWRRLVLEKIPLLALSGAICLVTILAQRHAIQSSESFPWPLRLANAAVSGAVYLRQWIFPGGLAALYPYPKLGLPVWTWALSALLLAALSALAWKERKTRPWLLTGWLWYLVMLLPVVGIIQVGVQAHADRYTYLPQIGICLAVVWQLAEWTLVRKLAPVLVPVVVLALGVLSWRQGTFWKDSDTLWTHALECTTRNGVAHNDLGASLDKEGDVENALGQFEAALKIDGGYAEFHNNYGHALREKGMIPEAIAQYGEALRIYPTYAEAEFNLGNVLAQTGRRADAIAHYEAALRDRPDYLDAHFNLANVLMDQGRPADAVAHFQAALAINPNNAAMHHNLGICYYQLGQPDRAAAEYRMALRLEPNDAGVENNLAWLLATAADPNMRQGQEALDLARDADALLDGKSPVVLGSMAAALAETGHFAEAVETARRALALAQGNAPLTSNLNEQLKFYEAGKPFHVPPPTR